MMCLGSQVASVPQGSVHTVYYSHRFLNVGEIFLQLQRFVWNDVFRIMGVPLQLRYMEDIMNTL